MLNSTASVRAHGNGGENRATSIIPIPTWAFQLDKGKVRSEKGNKTGEHSRVEAMVWIEMLRPILELITMYFRWGKRAILNCCVDWGRSSALRWFAMFMSENWPQVQYHFYRCNLHCWGNWVSDVSSRALAMVVPAGVNWGVADATDHLYWECRALIMNVTAAEDVIADHTSAIPVGSTSRSAERDANLHQLNELIRVLFEVCGLCREGGDQQQQRTARRARLVMGRAKRFYWFQTEDPELIREEGEAETPMEERKKLLKELILSVFRLVRCANTARWLSIGPSTTYILLLRWMCPGLAQKAFLKGETHLGISSI